MRRPLTGSARRPQRIHFRGNPRWEELFPHLKDLGIEVSIHDDLPEAVEVHLDFCRQMRKAGSGPIIMLSHRPTRVDQQFPAIGAWVQEGGWIEVGRRKEAGFVVRAMDDSGLAFENNRSKTLAEAMAALEEGLAVQFREHEATLFRPRPRGKRDGGGSVTMPEKARKMSEIMKEMSETLLRNPGGVRLRKRPTSPCSSPTPPGTRAWAWVGPGRAIATDGRRWWLITSPLTAASKTPIRGNHSLS